MTTISEKIKSFLISCRGVKYLFVSVILLSLLIIFVTTGGIRQFFSNAVITLYWIFFIGFTVVVLVFFCYFQTEKSEKKLADFSKRLKSFEKLTVDVLLETCSSDKDDNIEKICKSYVKSFLPSSIKEKEKTRANSDLYFGAVAWLEDVRDGYPVMQALKIIPGTFTGFGILGTFLGFANGVSQINTNGDFEVMKMGIDNLLSGLNIAFNSSIFGVIAAILVNFLLVQPILHRLQVTSKDLCDFLDENFYISEADAIMQYSIIVDEENNEIPFSMSLKAITEALNDVKSGMDKFTSEIADKLVNMQKEAALDVTNSLQAVLKENVIEQFDLLHENVNNVGNLLKQCTDVLEIIPEKINHATNKLIDSTNISLEAFKKQSESSIQTLNDSIRNNLNKHFDRYAERINESTETIIDINNALELLPVSLREINEAIAKTKNSMNDSVGQLSGFLEKIAQSVDNLGNLYQVFEKSTVLENDKFDRIVTQFSGLYGLYQAVNAECKEMLKEFKSMDSQLTDIYTTINDNTEKYSEIVGTSLNSYLKGFAEAAQEFSTGLSVAISGLSTTLEETKNLATSMSDSLDKYLKINKDK